MGRRGSLAAALAALALAGTAAAAPALASDFEHPASNDTSQQFGPNSVQRQDTPNDPDYDQSEPDTSHRTSSNLYDERFDLFGFPSQLTSTTARYTEGPHAGLPQVSGFNAAGAWKITRGRPDVVIAILDTGIRWDRASLRDQIHLNTGELPLPEGANGRTDPSAPLRGYDLNRNGAVDVDDYAADPRVLRVKPASQKLITGEDLIHAFSNHRDDDHNGFVDDIAGWDFFNDDNDPFDQSSYFAAANHGSGRAQDAAEQGNDGQGSIGVCPHCQIMPVRTWDTFVSDGDTFALGILYATDNGASVIEGANGSLYHSRFAEAASQYAYSHGVAQAFSGDDLNTGNHNYPANYNHTMLIQGTVPDTVGLGTNANELGFGGALPLATNLPPQTYFRNANTTQYGGHSSISMEGTTGSENTGKAAGAVGLVISAARDHGIRLSADESREILEQTAEDVLPGNTRGAGLADPSQPGWDTHFGWGRANLGAAVSVAASGKLPPQASIDSPDWYAPLTGPTARLTGRASARSGSFHYKVEWGPGLAPITWSTVREGDSSTPVTNLGTLNLDQIRAALASYQVPPDAGGPTFSPTSPNPYQQQFAVRLTVTQDGVPTPGVDRKVFTAVADPTLRRGYPRRMGTGGEAPIRYADINGDGTQELLVPLEDGTLNAYEPNGRELRGFPVRTDTLAQARAHLSAPGLRRVGAPREPLRAVEVADLDGDGQPELISAAGRHVYVWEANGRRRRGFPVSIDPAFCRGADQRQPLVHRKCGFLASPALGRLRGPSGGLDVVIAGLDGHLYAWDPRGRALSGFPVDLSDPGMPPDKRMLAESINDAAIGDLNGDGRDDVVIATNEAYGANQSPSDLAGGFAQGLADILAGAAGGSSRVYAVDGRTGKFLPGWPISLNGAIQTELPLIGPGHDAALVKVGGQQVVVVSTTGGALAEYSTDGKLIRDAQQGAFGPLSNITDRTGVELNLFEYASVGDVLGNGGRDLVKYAVTAGQLANLALSGQNFPYNHTIGAYDATNGAPLPAYPTITDDYQFLSASNIAKVDPSTTSNQILAGTGLGLLHAYDGATGRDVPGFPKVTGGWLFAPPALSDDGRIADITREGYLFEWTTRAPRCQSQWPSFRHDDHATGNYDADGTAPGAPLRLRLARGRLSFVSPGDDGRCGRATAYLAWMNGRPAKLALGAPVPAGAIVSRAGVKLPKGTRTLAVAARDEAGNVGPAATLTFRSATRRRAAPHRRRAAPRRRARPHRRRHASFTG